MALADDLVLEQRRALAEAGNSAVAEHILIFLAAVRAITRKIAAIRRIDSTALFRIRLLVRASLAELRERLVSDMLGRQHAAARRAWALARKYFNELDARILGARRPLAFESEDWIAAAVRDLDPRRVLIERSYSRLAAETIQVTEIELVRVEPGAPGPEVAASLAAALLKGQQAQEPRIASVARTETAFAFGAIGFAAILAEDTPAAPCWKRLVATFDTRTGKDSRLLHGQTRRAREMFYDAVLNKYYPHPPNRPHDREILVGWRDAWGVAEVVETPIGEVARLGSRPSTRYVTPPGAARLRSARNLRPGDVLARGRGQVVGVKERGAEVVVLLAGGRTIAYDRAEQVRVLPK